MAKNISVYLSWLLRHGAPTVGLAMDVHGWVSTEELIATVNAGGQHTITMKELQTIVAQDRKGRYRFSDDLTRIKACQGHSIPGILPELTYPEVPEFLYHGTTTEALQKIMDSGAIKKMERHAVHLQQEPAPAWASACRWRGCRPVLLRIAARKLSESGVVFGLTDNNIWCAEEIPVSAIAEVLYRLPEKTDPQ